MKKPIIFLLLIFVQLVLCFPISFVQTSALAVNKNDTDEALKITSKSALLIEAESGKVIFEKNANDRLPIASMTKIATLSIVFDALSKGIIHENDMVKVSETAAAVGGSSAFLDAGSSYKLTELIKSVIVASANDSSVALAEYVSGSEDVFVTKMNKLASSLNLENTNFINCTGLPSNNHYSTAYDIAKIYNTIAGNSLYKKYSKIWMDDFIHPSGRKTGLVNTNRLIKTFDGIEGGKTGYTDAARFCLTASAKRENTRFIGVIIGANDSKTRFAEMTKLLNYGFSNYTNKLVVNSEIPVTITSVKKSKEMAEVYAERNSNIFVKKTEDGEYHTDYQLYDVSAPLKSNAVVGKMFVFDSNNMVVDEVNLVIKKPVEAEKFKDTFNKIVSAW